MYYIKNIHMEGNEHGQLHANVIYAELHDAKGNICISATLQHILEAIRDRRLETKNVVVEYKFQRGYICSTIILKGD